ncbi:flagellar outer dynein arm heavy chain gamma [Dorcoceras hygrometricum]|uniref:Flagellar outer dynein arm heavy chain gamma n=1 Tax=Dorcoceras hygrometricum TaxID=472368 RepID=A0A2Z7AJJ9_9LAMI|nr:flagellar outer dynein arm heavy chain gamma [Dorcoceras hygrometricum]
MTLYRWANYRNPTILKNNAKRSESDVCKATVRAQIENRHRQGIALKSDYLMLARRICLAGVRRCELLLEEVSDGQWSRVVQMSTLVNEISLTLPLPPALSPAEIVLPVKIWHHTFTAHMTNQIKRRNVSSLTYENFPGGHPSQKVPLEDLMFTASVTTQSPSLALGELLATPINNQEDATAEYNT